MRPSRPITLPVCVVSLSVFALAAPPVHAQPAPPATATTPAPAPPPAAPALPQAATPSVSRTATGLQTAKLPIEDDGLPAKEPAHDAAARKLFDFLVKEYNALLAASPKDRIGRSLLIVCMSRLPREDVTTRLFDMLEAERDPLVKVTAWEAVLARARHLSPEQHQRLAAVTASLATAGLFRGDLRATAARVLATAAPDVPTKAAWNALYLGCHPHRDGRALAALAAAVVRWRTPDVIDFVVRKAGVNFDEAARAVPVLVAAGSTGPAVPETPGMLKVFGPEHARWWNAERPKWKPVTTPDDAARLALTPLYLPGPVDLSKVDPKDKVWYRDLELRAPNIRHFDVAFCVDATGSMGAVLTWLKVDVARMMLAFGTVAMEPRIGLTFYRDHGKGEEFLTRTFPLTGRVEDLVSTLGKMTAAGGGDIPEAVLDGLQDCIKGNRWSPNADARKAIILIGDAPPKPGTVEQCEEAARAAAARGFRVYAVKCDDEGGKLPEFDRIVAAGQGGAISVGLAELARSRVGARMEMADLMDLIEAAESTRGMVRAGADGSIIGPDGKVLRRGGVARDARTGLPVAGDPAEAPARSAGQRVVTQVLIDAINPGFKDRVDPMVSILWQLLEDPVRLSNEMRAGVTLNLPKRPAPAPVPPGK